MDKEKAEKYMIATFIQDVVCYIRNDVSVEQVMALINNLDRDSETYKGLLSLAINGELLPRKRRELKAFYGLMSVLDL